MSCKGLSNSTLHVCIVLTRSTQRTQTSLAEADHYSHIAPVKMLSLGGERLPPPPPPRQDLKKIGSLPAPRYGYATTITVFFFAHLLILEYPDHHHNLISSSLYYPGPLHEISSQSVHNFLSNVVHRQTDRQTNATKSVTFFAKEVIMDPLIVLSSYTFHW